MESHIVSSSQVSATGDLYVAHFDFADNAEHGRIASDPAEASEKPKHPDTCTKLVSLHIAWNSKWLPVSVDGWRLPCESEFRLC